MKPLTPRKWRPMNLHMHAEPHVRTTAHYLKQVLACALSNTAHFSYVSNLHSPPSLVVGDHTLIVEAAAVRGAGKHPALACFSPV